MNDKLLQPIDVHCRRERSFSPRFPRRGAGHAGYNPGRLCFSVQAYHRSLCRRKDVEACLKLVCCRLWSLNDNAIQYGFQLSYIMSIRPSDDDQQRDAMLFHQQMAFASFFSPSLLGSDQPPPEPKVLWSWHYLYSARTRICPPFHHIPPARLATWPGIPQPFPTGESRHERNWGYRISLWGGPSIDSRCEEHKQYLQIPYDNLTAFCRHLFSGYKICSGSWSVAVRVASHASKKHRKQPMTGQPWHAHLL